MKTIKKVAFEEENKVWKEKEGKKLESKLERNFGGMGVYSSFSSGGWCSSGVMRHEEQAEERGRVLVSEDKLILIELSVFYGDAVLG